MKNDLEERLFNFSVEVIKAVRKLPNSKEYQVVSYQV